MRVHLLGIAVATVLACIPLSAQAQSDVPLPTDVTIVLPDPTIPKDLAGFSGKWVGVWDNVLNHVLVVEKVEPTSASVIYATGTYSGWNATPRWARYRGDFIGPQLVIHLGSAVATYVLQSDGTLAGRYELGRGRPPEIRMTRAPISTSAAPGPITKFDGDYAGLSRSLSSCGGNYSMTLTIKSGELSFLANPTTALTFSGPVADDGSVSAIGRNRMGGSGMLLTGHVSGGKFEGRTSGLSCDFEVSVTLASAGAAQTATNVTPPSTGRPASASSTKFDGDYAGMSRSLSSCGGSYAMTLTIKNGELSLLANPSTALTFSGPVTDDGSVSAIGRNRMGVRGMLLSGRVSGGKFEGRTSGLNCDFEVSVMLASGATAQTATGVTPPSTGQSGLDLALPPGMTASIEPLNSSTPPAYARFIGKWGGNWESGLPSNLIVESVTASGEARGIYAWGTSPVVPASGAIKFRAKIQGEKLSWGDPVNGIGFEFTMQSDGKLRGERYDHGGQAGRVTMTKM
jgi:hypothetical protein